MSQSSLILLLSNLAATLFLFGVIWVVQIVVYPQFARCGTAEFVAYHAEHTTRMGLVVALPMLVELATSALLAFAPPAGVSSVGRSLLWWGFVLTVLTWAVTFFISIPLHERLASGYNESAWRSLVTTNGIRTALWTAHAGIVLDVLRRVLTSANRIE